MQPTFPRLQRRLRPVHFFLACIFAVQAMLVAQSPRIARATPEQQVSSSPALLAAPTPTGSPAFSVALTGTGQVGPSGIVTLLASISPGAGETLGTLEASASGADGQWQTLTTFATADPVTRAAGFDLTQAAYGGNTSPGQKTIYLRVADASGNFSTVTLAVTFNPALPTFGDVPGNLTAAEAEAIRQMAARGVILGYSNGNFGPNDTTQRAQMAALIAREMGWGTEDWGNNFTDRGGLVESLWRNVGTLQHYQVAFGYDGNACAQRNTGSPCFGPTEAVTRAQTISFITRAMVKKGYWQQRTGDPNPFPNVPQSSGHVADLATYVHYVGAPPGATAGQNWPSWSDTATRGWFAQAEWLVVQWLERAQNWATLPAPPFPSKGVGIAVNASTSDKTPAVGDGVTLAAGLTQGSQPLAGVPLTATLTYSGGSASCTGTSGGDGRASCLTTIAQVMAGKAVTVDTVFVYQGANYAARVVLNVAASVSPSPTPTPTPTPTPAPPSPPVVVPGPTVAITSPANLSLTNVARVTVSGTIDDPAATVTVGGVAATVSGTTFSIDNVFLREGRTTITAVARNAAGSTSTASITVLRDATPPTLILETPGDGAQTTAETVTVTGQVSDPKGGTINSGDVTVRCVQQPGNLQYPAVVLNRGFAIGGVALRGGRNTLACTATDRAGNTTTAPTVTVWRQALAVARIERVSGQDQVGPAGATLAAPLIVRLVDAAGLPVAGRAVSFRVARGGGTLVGAPAEGRRLEVVTGTDGRATARFTLGERAGAGNHQVVATAVGFAGEVTFLASATAGSATRLLAIAGEHQRGAVGGNLPLPLMVLVLDAKGNPVAGASVTYQVTRGGGGLVGAAPVAGVTARPAVLVANTPSITVTTDSDGRAAVVFRLGSAAGINAHAVEANVGGSTSQPATFTATALQPGLAEQTRISGVVLDNALTPIPGAVVRVKDTSLLTTTDAEGHFTITGIPVGTIHLIADGATSPRPETFPMLEFELVTISGQDNTVGMPILLPALDRANAQVCGGAQACVLEMAGVPGAKLEITPDSVVFKDGSRVGQITWTQVQSDKVPMPPANGVVALPAWTIQPHGALFTTPARVTLPNTTGLPPGAQAEMFQFDHDIEEFVSVGTGTVSADGATITSDPGFGVTKAGWGHGAPPPPPPTTVKGKHDCDSIPSLNPLLDLLVHLNCVKNEVQPVTNSLGPALDKCLDTGDCADADRIGQDYRDAFSPGGSANRGINEAIRKALSLEHEAAFSTEDLLKQLIDPTTIAKWLYWLRRANTPSLQAYSRTDGVPIEVTRVTDIQMFRSTTANPDFGVFDFIVTIAILDGEEFPIRIGDPIPLGHLPVFVEHEYTMMIANVTAHNGSSINVRVRGISLPAKPHGEATVLSRTAQVEDDGTFQIANVPADGRLVRVQAVWNVANMTTTLYSDFTVATPGTVTNVEVKPENIRPPAKSIIVSSPIAVLSQSAKSTQLSIIGKFSDNTTEDLTQASSGTSYISSNTSICVVSNDGMVTAIGSGTCIITAVNSGVLGSIQLQAQLSADADGDGLPDDFEARYACLNPAANDAGADPDADGLTNAQEFGRGTNPCAADSDGDGLNDGNEIARGTNPASPDSDLDGLLDGDEVARGSNPLNRDSDGDGLPDGVEVALVGNPTGATPNGDNDGDGLTNRDEVEVGTNPAQADTDGDGLSDAEEIVTRQTDPLQFDTDDDGYGDGFEVALGSNPLVAASIPVIRPANAAAGNAVTVYNIANPAQGSTLPGAAAGLAVSVYNTANPAQTTTVPGAAAGSAFSVYNTADPAENTTLPGAAAGPAISVHNIAPSGGVASPDGLGFNEGGP